MERSTFVVTVTCCGEPVQRLRMVRPRGATEWFLAPGGESSYRAIRDGRESADTGVTGAADERIRWRFRCDQCGTEVPARDERLRRAVELLRGIGRVELNLSELRAILSKS